MGERGTGKSTLVRSLAEVMPKKNNKIIPVIDLPLGATEDRIIGTIDIEHALTSGEKRFEPGLLAKANNGFLYIDEVNLLEDHLIDLLLDVAASGENIVEREGISVKHEAKFALIGSGNPEEGDLRPQLLDRFGLFCMVNSEKSITNRVELIKRRFEFDNNPIAFKKKWEFENRTVLKRISKAQKSIDKILLNDEILETIAKLCVDLEVHGHRGEIVITRAIKANAALDNRDQVTLNDLFVVAPLALAHRTKNDPLESMSELSKIEISLKKLNQFK